MTYQIPVFPPADNQLIDQLTSEKKILNFEPQVFCPDYVAKIRSGLSITVLEKKTQNPFSLIKKEALQVYSVTSKGELSLIWPQMTEIPLLAVNNILKYQWRTLAKEGERPYVYQKVIDRRTFKHSLKTKLDFPSEEQRMKDAEAGYLRLGSHNNYTEKSIPSFKL